MFNFNVLQLCEYGFFTLYVEVTMAALHSRCYIIITIYGNDAVNYYMHLQMFVAYAHATKNKVYLTHDESSQLQFDLIQAQTMAHLPAFAMAFGCLLKIPISHFQ